MDTTGFIGQTVVGVVVNILRATFVDDDVGCLMIRMGGGV